LESQATLDTTFVDLSNGRRKTLKEIVVGWAQHVERLRAEEHSNLRKDPDVWGAHDFLAALYLRDLVERGLDRSSPSVFGQAQLLVADADRSFTDFTVDDTQEVVVRFSGEDHLEAAWWWHRIPKMGPAREDLLNSVR
jgi:hypothetical protein